MDFLSSLPEPMVGSGERLEQHFKNRYEHLFPGRTDGITRPNVLHVFPGETGIKTERYTTYSSVIEGSALKNCLVRYFFLAQLSIIDIGIRKKIVDDACINIPGFTRITLEPYFINQGGPGGQNLPLQIVHWFCGLDFHGSWGISEETSRKIAVFLNKILYIGIADDKKRNRRAFITEQLTHIIASWIANNTLPDPRQKIDPSPWIC